MLKSGIPDMIPEKKSFIGNKPFNGSFFNASNKTAICGPHTQTQHFVKLNIPRTSSGKE